MKEFEQVDKTIVRHGTATPGGGFPVYGDAFAATLNEVDPTLAVTPTNTKGSTENVPLLEAGQLDTGQCTGEVLYEAIAGIGRKPADVKILSAMYSNSGMFIVRADSPYKAVADLKGKPIAWGAAGSGFIVLARASALWMIYLSRIIDGATAGNLSLAQAYIADNTTPENRARSFGLIGIAFGLGFFIGPSLTGYLSARYGLTAQIGRAHV